MRRRDLFSDVRYVVDLDLRSNRSRTLVEFGCSSPGTSSFADLAVASVESLSLNGSPLAASAWRDGRLELAGLESSNVLEVTAGVSSEGNDRGLVSFVDAGGERFVYTYGRTDGVARWTPCFLDVPATWDLRVSVPDGWTVLSHGPPTSPPVQGVWRFLPPYPLPDGPTFAAGRRGSLDVTSVRVARSGAQRPRCLSGRHSRGIPRVTRRVLLRRPRVPTPAGHGTLR